MHVVHVISGLGTGGAETFLATLAPKLRDRGITQTVVSLTGDGPLASRLEDERIPVVGLDARGAIGAVQAAWQLRRVLGELKPDVVQGWMYHGDLFATLAHRLARSRRRRLYWNIRCSDMRLADYSYQLRMVVRGCIWASGMPDAVLANSAAGARVHVEAGYRPRRLLIVPNGIDCSRFAPNAEQRRAVRAELGLDDKAVLVLHVARVDPMKDHSGLLAAAERITGATIALIGSGTKALARPPHVVALGQRADVARLLAAGDIVVSGSAYGEGFSNAIAEGMAAGLVPVATNVGDAAEIVGDCGLLVQPRDPAALAAALQSTIDLSEAERSRRGSAARDRIVSRYALERAAERFEAIYRGADA